MQTIPHAMYIYMRIYKLLHSRKYKHCNQCIDTITEHNKTPHIVMHRATIHTIDIRYSTVTYFILLHGYVNLSNVSIVCTGFTKSLTPPLCKHCRNKRGPVYQSMCKSSCNNNNSCLLYRIHDSSISALICYAPLCHYPAVQHIVYNKHHYKHSKEILIIISCICLHPFILILW